MTFISELLISTLALYLAFTNTLADKIEFLLDKPNESESVLVTPELVELDSRYRDSQSIPRILLENSEYQRAVVVDGVLTTNRPASPLQALVNIFCQHTTDTYVRSTTGSGYFIHPNGVILTNAHVAQFLLLDGINGGESSCIIRTGSPATATYEIDLLYISPAWIQENAKLLSVAMPEGTGERDYALLYVTGHVDKDPLPAFFPALPADTNLLSVQAVSRPVRAAGYPAAAVTQEGARAELKGIEVGTRITEIMTFGSGYADLFTIAGTPIGEQGSSGGPVVNESGAAIGLISTRGDDTLFGTGSLRAISLSYVDRTIKEETGYGLAENVTGNLPYRARIFRETLVPFLQFWLKFNI
jgi:S1-C subfamily serine protease